MTASYTAAQLAAFASLPADGSEMAFDPGRLDLMYALEGLKREYGFVDDGCVDEGAYRLTPAGIAERARLVEMGEIK